MSSVALKRVVQPSVEPITVAEAKLYTKISGNTEDALVARWIKAGRILAENYQRRSYMPQRWRLTLDAYPSDTEEIWLPRGPLKRLISIIVTDTEGTETALDITNFLVDTDTQTIRLSYDLNYVDLVDALITNDEFELKNIKILYETGYGPDLGVTTTTGEGTGYLPSYVADALFVYIAYRYENRLGETNMIPSVFYQILDAERNFRGLL